jgi:hypothetical protein
MFEIIVGSGWFIERSDFNRAILVHLFPDPVVAGRWAYEDQCWGFDWEQSIPLLDDPSRVIAEEDAPEERYTKEVRLSWSWRARRLNAVDGPVRLFLTYDDVSPAVFLDVPDERFREVVALLA